VRDDELEAILTLIDGWPAALTFALRTSTRANDLRTVSAGTREMVYRYLAEQVWKSLDDRIRGFLRTAAFLPRVETRLAVAAGFDDAAAIIESLRERVAFISVLDAGVYKLHDLFRDFVQRQIQLEGDEALREAQASAGRLLERMGMHGEALERFADARAPREVERVLARYHFVLLEKGCFDVVERALRSLPAPIASGNAHVLALRAALEEAHGRVDQAERWYVAVLERVAGDVPFRVAVATRYALLLYQQARFDAIPVLEALRDRDDLAQPERAAVLGVLGITYAYAGRHAEAHAAAEEALQLAELGDDGLRGRTFARAGAVALFASDEALAETYTREATRITTELGEFGMAARFFTTLTSLHASAGRLPVAAWYATQVAANAEKAGDPQTRVHGLRMLLQLEAERGNAERVAQIDRELGELSYRGHLALPAYLYGKTLQLVGSGKLHDAHALLAGASGREMAPFQNRLRFALLATVLAKLGDRSAAVAALEEHARAAARDTDASALYARARGLADRFAILANLLLERNALAQRALRALRATADDLSAFDAWLAALLNRVPERADAALEAMRSAGVAGIARFADALARELLVPLVGVPAEVLTPVELHVLRAMANGLSNQAIADDQRRTINTVRTHVSSILRKLSCTSRGEAVAEARRQHLL
jgi:ATP/maltotriose-dependent transcriptional regulator MalT